MSAQPNTFVFAAATEGSMPVPAEFSIRAKEASEVLKALAHEGRLVILSLLCTRERSVTELETILALRQPAVSQQLARLRADNLVKTRREGKLIYYSIASEEARVMIRTLAELYPEA